MEDKGPAGADPTVISWPLGTLAIYEEDPDLAMGIETVAWMGRGSERGET